MATVEELTGLLKGLADVVKSQQQTNSTALQQTTEQLQNLSSTVEALSKTMTPHTTLTQSSNASPAGLRLPNITLPVFTRKENLDRFIEQLTSLLHSSGVSPRFWVTYLKQQTQKDARAYDTLIEAEKQHKHFLGDTPDKASPAEFTEYFDACVELYELNAANRGINKLETYYINITPCNRETKNPLLSSLIVLHKPSWNWRSSSQYSLITCHKECKR